MLSGGMIVSCLLAVMEFMWEKRKMHHDPTVSGIQSDLLIRDLVIHGLFLVALNSRFACENFQFAGFFLVKKQRKSRKKTH